MMFSVGLPRNTPRFVYRYYQRLGRCTARAMKENGSLDKQMHDLIVLGRCGYTKEEQEIDIKRAMELMEGLKP